MDSVSPIRFKPFMLLYINLSYIELVSEHVKKRTLRYIGADSSTYSARTLQALCNFLECLLYYFACFFVYLYMGRMLSCAHVLISSRCFVRTTSCLLCCSDTVFCRFGAFDIIALCQPKLNTKEYRPRFRRIVKLGFNGIWFNAHCKQLFQCFSTAYDVTGKPIPT